MSASPETRTTIRTESYAMEEKVFEEGQRGDCLYIVKEGEVDLYCKGRILAKVEKGGIFGEMALIDYLPRSATAVAKTDCELVRVEEKDFRRIVKENPLFALEVMRVLVQRLRMMNSMF